jgi:hypothetical protein
MAVVMNTRPSDDVRSMPGDFGLGDITCKRAFGLMSVSVDDVSC